jgi:hypothetical protein
MAYHQLRMASPTRCLSTHGQPHNILIPLTWGQTHIASLPQNLLQTNLPNLAYSLRRGKPHIEVRSHLESSSYSGAERYRKAAAAILQYIETLADPDATSTSASNPLSRYLEKKVMAEQGEPEPKALCGFVAVLYVARAFGCVNAVRMPLEHFLLLFGRQLGMSASASELEEWRDNISDLGCRGAARDEIEARFPPSSSSSSGASMGGWAVSTSTALVPPGELPRGRGFDATLVGNPDALREWRGCKSIFAAVTPEGLQQVLGQLGGGNTLVPPRVAADGELLDSAREVVCVEIRKLDRGADRLRGRVGEWLARSFPRERWGNGGSAMGPWEAERWREA